VHLLVRYQPTLLVYWTYPAGRDSGLKYGTVEIILCMLSSILLIVFEKFLFIGTGVRLIPVPGGNKSNDNNRYTCWVERTGTLKLCNFQVWGIFIPYHTENAKWFFHVKCDSAGVILMQKKTICSLTTEGTKKYSCIKNPTKLSGTLF